MSSSATSIDLQFVPPTDNGGATISSYKLYYDTIQSTENYVLIYSGSDLSVNLDTTDGLVASTVYRFVLVASNSFGDSEQSEELRAALGSLPDQPNAPEKVEEESSLTSIKVEWDFSAIKDGISATGYKLYADDGRNGAFTEVYNGERYPNVNEFNLGNLVTGNPYRFKVSALNINGESDASASTTIYACLKPTNVAAPYYISSTETSIEIGWTEPKDNGCDITGFEIYRDTGNNDGITIQVDAASVSDKPSLRRYDITGLTNTGNEYRFRIRAINDAGYTESSPVSIVLANVPDTPSTGPSSDATVTNDQRIKVDFGPQSSVENGGSEIISYELQMDNGKGGVFTCVIGCSGDSLETEFTIASGIAAGNYYRFKYRSYNINGASSFSPITYITAATVPARPPAPTFDDASDTTITLSFSPSTDSKGSEITEYELYINAGGSSADFDKVEDYDGSSLTHTLTVGVDQITAGTDAIAAGIIYKFKYLAINDYGSSDFSDEVEAGVSDFPDAPAAPTKVEEDSGETFITLSWTSVADPLLPVIGYILNIDDGFGGDKTVLYDGSNQPNVLQYTASGLITGLTYTFTVQAVNYNGLGDESAEASFIICVDPFGFDAPYLISSTETTLTVGWKAPSSNGGCQVKSYYLYMNDGAGGTVYSEIDAATINDSPTLREHTISSFLVADTGKTYSLYMEAENIVGLIESEKVSIVLAAVPDKPTTSPSLVIASTSAFQIGVEYDALLTTEDGGSDILSYELQIYNTTLG